MIFTGSNETLRTSLRANQSRKYGDSLFAQNHAALTSRGAAPSPLHTPVNSLHSIESKVHTKSLFLLTQKIEGVKHNCSLTVSEVFPVGAASGGQARSPSADGKSGA